MDYQIKIFQAIIFNSAIFSSAWNSSEKTTLVYGPNNYTVFKTCMKFWIGNHNVYLLLLLNIHVGEMFANLLWGIFSWIQCILFPNNCIQDYFAGVKIYLAEAWKKLEDLLNCRDFKHETWLCFSRSMYCQQSQEDIQIWDISLQILWAILPALKCSYVWLSLSFWLCKYTFTGQLNCSCTSFSFRVTWFCKSFRR